MILGSDKAQSFRQRVFDKPNMPKKVTNRATQSAARKQSPIEFGLDREIISLVESAAKAEGISFDEWTNRAFKDGLAVLKP